MQKVKALCKICFFFNYTEIWIGIDMHLSVVFCYVCQITFLRGQSSWHRFYFRVNLIQIMLEQYPSPSSISATTQYAALVFTYN